MDDCGRGEDVVDGALSRHVRGIKQQLEVCSTASDLPSPGRSTSTLCLICGASLFFCDPGLAWLSQPATAPLTAHEYDTVTLDTTRHDYTPEAEVGSFLKLSVQHHRLVSPGSSLQSNFKHRVPRNSPLPSRIDFRHFFHLTSTLYGTAGSSSLEIHYLGTKT